MDWAEIEAVVYGECEHPENILGPHNVGKQTLVQAFFPGTKKVSLYIDGKEGTKSIEIVGIEDGEGTFNNIAATVQGVGGAKRLDPALRENQTLGKVIGILECVPDADAVANTGCDGVTEDLVVLTFDDKYYFVKTGTNGIVNGIVDDKLAGGTQRVNLLQTAIAVPHTCG